MKQVIQHLRSANLELIDVPCPGVSRGHALIHTGASLISAGTERRLVEFGQASLVAKARQQPERVQQVLEKLRSDGILPTMEAVFARLDQPLPLGYCNAGTVIAVGEDVGELAPGDRVANNGPHAEMVHVPSHLCAKIPPSLRDDQACFAVLGAIGLQGIRLVQPTLGESVVVYGLGLVGLLSIQMLAAAGVRLLGIDTDPDRLAIAERFGVATANANHQEIAEVARAFSQGRGVDAVLITASARQDDIVHQSANMCRKRGRMVLVGDVNLDLRRADFYDKELQFQVSCSYGPGRYDPAYEEGGRDYPLAYVRWTEQRNIQTVLELMASGKLDVDSLVTSRIPHGQAERAYELLGNDRSQLGIVFQYPDSPPPIERVVSYGSSQQTTVRSENITAGIIGSGGYTVRALLPELKRAGVRLITIAGSHGIQAATAARKFSIESSTSDYRCVLEDSRVNTVFITNRNHLHVPMVVEALESGKHVFVEKPLAIDLAGLSRVKDACRRHPQQILTIGFNRRFSPHAQKMRQLLDGRHQPVTASVLINAGQLPPDHWQHDPAVGGGRIIGEACHWIDLMQFLFDSPLVSVQAARIGKDPGLSTRCDLTSMHLSFADGSLAAIQYYANGSRSFPKERIEIFSEGRILQLDNFRVLRGFGWRGFRRMRLLRQDKGHRLHYRGFCEAVSNGDGPPIPLEEIWAATEASIACERSAQTGHCLQVGEST